MYTLPGDYTPVEVFEWHEDENEPWIKEAQYAETVTPSEEFPDGISVAWIVYEETSQIPTTLPAFFAASFPRKPGKRGGSPANP